MFESFIGELAQGPFLIFAAVVGVIVSIDVCVVELSREYKDENGRSLYSARKRWMVMWHSLFHALSFLIYMLTIYLLQTLTFWPILNLDVPDGVGTALIVIINFLVICFVWWTYRTKIKEDHSEKTNDETAVDRRDMQLFVDIIRALAQKLGIGDGARGISIAGAVAVDMLAVSALLKSYLIRNGEAPAISTFTGYLLIDLLIFSLVIGFCVAILVINAQLWGPFLRKSLRYLDFITALRLIEPFAIFVIASGTLRHLIEFVTGSPSAITGLIGYLFDAVFSSIIVASILIGNGQKWSDLRLVYGQTNLDSASSNPAISFREILRDIQNAAPLIVYLLAFFLFVVVAVIYSFGTIEGENSHNHLIETTGWLAAGGLLFSIVILYVPSRRLDAFETGQTGNLSSLQSESAFGIWSLFFGVAIALLAFNALNILAVGWWEGEVQAIALWSLYVLITLFLFDIRRWRFYRSQTADDGGERKNDTNFAEFVSAFGFASSVIALIATFAVTTLIG